MFGVNHFNLLLSLTTVIFNVAHVGKEVFGPQMLVPVSKCSSYCTCPGI